MNIAAIWLGLPQWARDAIKVAGIVVGVIFLGRQYVKSKESDAVQRDRATAAIKQAQIKEAVTTRSAEIIREERDNADAAITARNSGGGFVDAGSVPDPIASVLFRDERRGEAG